MKKLVLACVLAIALSSTAMASDIVFYTGTPNTEGWYDVATMQADVETIISMTGNLFIDVQQFDDTQLDQLGEWVEANTNDGELDILWLNGTMPSVLYPNANVETDGSLVELWLDGGNMIINVGDWFAYTTFEGGTRGTDNGSAGAANILDLAAGIIVSADGTSVTPTAAGQEYIPSLGTAAFVSDRPIALSQVVAPWEVAAVFASTDGTENADQADPIVIHNTETGAYVAFVNQGGSGHWLDDRGLACAELIGNWVTAVIGLGDPMQAKSPTPENGQTDVLRDVVLSWAPGESAATHDVYFGAVFEDVNAATATNPLDVLLSQGQTGTTFALPETLDFATTYYWRIDEISGAPDFTVTKGKVWSFATEQFAYPIENITVTTNTTSDEGQGPDRIVDGSGLNENDEHSVNTADMWGGNPNPTDPSYLLFQFDSVYKLHELLVWNYNMEFEMFLGLGVKNATLEYSEDGDNWTSLGDFELAQATSSATYTANTIIPFDGVPAQYVRMTVNGNFAGSTQLYGLSEVRFLSIPVQPSRPEPADQATNVGLDTELTWRPGREAVSHEIYLGTDPNALSLAGTTTEASYTPADLQLDTTSYWQVVEINDAETPSAWAGDVWSFSTQPYVVIDDFESYIDDEAAGDVIWEIWIDGLVEFGGDAANGGSQVGHNTSPFAEQTIVHSGSQSMPLYFDNANASAISEADRSFAPAQDWSGNAIKSLSLWFYGAEGNTGQLYVKINETQVLYDGGASDIGTASWQPWNIDLSAVGNVSNVTKMSVGVQGAGSGVVYIDDIRLYPLTPEYVTPVEPDPAGLAAHYTFDEGSGTVANDGSGNGNTATFEGDPTWVQGYLNGALEFDGVGDYLDCGQGASLAIGEAVTMSAWIQVYAPTLDQKVGGNQDNTNGGYKMGLNSSKVEFEIRTADNTAVLNRAVAGGTTLVENVWYHVTGVYSQADGYIRTYVNGALDRELATSDVLGVSPGNLYIGCEPYNTANGQFNGVLDDVRIYNRAMSPGEVAGLAGKTSPFHKPF